MKECKKCKRVKGDSKFFNIIHNFYGINFCEETWLCNDCADEIGYKARVEEAKKINKLI